MRHGDMICEGETLYVMECEPAGYALSQPMRQKKPPKLTYWKSPLLVPMDDLFGWW